MSDRQQMTEEERYLDYGFEHRVTAVKGKCQLKSSVKAILRLKKLPLQISLLLDKGQCVLIFTVKIVSACLLVFGNSFD